MKKVFLTALALLALMSIALPAMADSKCSAIGTTGTLSAGDTFCGIRSSADIRLTAGTMAYQAASAVTITGGSITGITDLAVADGGTGLSSGTSGGVLYYSGSTTLASSAALTANSPVLGGGAGVAPKVVAGITSDGTSKITLGVAGSSVGAVAFNNATSGSVTLQPVTGALGAVTLSLPAATDTLVGKATTDTLTNKTLTSPKIGTSLLDTNGNELFFFTATASAVNEITLANAATGNNPTITASGGDSNTGITITGKGTKGISIGNALLEKVVTVADTAGSVIDASLGNVFQWTAAADRTAGTTTNPVAGQKMILIFFASGGARTLTLPTATTGDFAFGSDITGLTQTASGKADVIGCIYGTVIANRWAVVAYAKGY